MRYVGIDPSTKTGFVALNAEGEVLAAKEIEGIGKVDPKRMATLIDAVMRSISTDDKVFIENFSFNSGGNFVGQQFGIGYMIRDRLYRKGINYMEVAPTSVKMFGADKGNASKKDMRQPIIDTWGFDHKSDNVRDAYVMAQICRTFHTKDIIGITDKQMAVIEKLRGVINLKA